MSTEAPQRKDKARILKLLAAALAVVPLIRGVTGYHSSDLGWMMPMLAAAAVIFFIADRIG